MNDPTGKEARLFQVLDRIRADCDEAQRLVADTIIERGNDRPVVISHATHAVVIPPGAFCCDAMDEP